MPPIINKEKCNACGICAEICPIDVFGVTDNGDIPVVTYPDVKPVIYCPLGCGDLHNGFARVKCGDCSHEYLLAFLCI